MGPTSCCAAIPRARLRLFFALVATVGAAIALVPYRASAARKPLTQAAWIRSTLARMTLPEEVGQLFEVNGYGRSVRDPSPAMVKLNRQYYGVDNIAQLVAKCHLGGIIYFDWTSSPHPRSSGCPTASSASRSASARRCRW